MASPYGKLKVPEFKSWDAGKAQGDYFSVLGDNQEKAAASARSITEANQEVLDASLKKALGEGYRETWGAGMNTLRAQAEGRFTDEQETAFRNMYTAQAQERGLAGSGAGLNLQVSGMGREMMRMSQQALSFMPNFMGSMQQALMATPTRVESLLIPIQQYAAQSAADNVNAWRQQYAQAQADHQAEMANTAYRLQTEQRERAESIAKERETMATRNAVARSNSAAWGVRGSLQNLKETMLSRGRRGLGQYGSMS